MKFNKPHVNTVSQFLLVIIYTDKLEKIFIDTTVFDMHTEKNSYFENHNKIKDEKIAIN